jgi:hypothetical protein
MVFHKFDLLITGFIGGAVALLLRDMLFACFRGLGWDNRVINGHIEKHVCKHRSIYLQGILSAILGFFVVAPMVSGIYCGIYKIDTKNLLLTQDYILIPLSIAFVFGILNLYKFLKKKQHNRFASK